MSVFSSELITFALNATDKVDAISQMAKMVVAAGRGSDADAIIKDVLARDEMGTPQVDGVAIPHARTSGVSESNVAVARCVNKNVIFDADEGAAEVLFMILVPNDAGDEHITILSSLARRLMDEEFTKALRSTTDAAELVGLLENPGEGN
jgi:PTS system fructose-specific IIC component